MVYTCYVCKWRSDKEPKRSFHLFPRQEDETRKWLNIIGKGDAIVGKWTALCCLHFEESCFRYGLVYGHKILKKGSLPSLHLNNSTGLTNSSCIIPNKANSAEKSTHPVVSPSQTETVTICETVKLLPIITLEDEYTKENTSANNMTLRRVAEEIDGEVPEKKQRLISNSTFDKTTFLIQINYLKSQLRERNRNIINLNRKLRRYKKNKLKLQDRVKNFRLRIRELEKQVKSGEPKSEPIMETILSQAKLNKKRIMEYPTKLKAFASTVSYLSPKTYKYIQTVLPDLPDISTIKRWRREIKVLPGVCKQSLEVMSLKVTEAKKLDKQLLCNVVMDDVALRKHGAEKTKSRLLTAGRRVLIIMVVCINDTWKIPLAYYFTDGLSDKNRADIVLQCLTDLHSTGVTVTSLTFDGAASNIKMAKHLEVDIRNVENFTKYFPHPITKEPVYLILDARHAVKLIRNSLAHKRVLLDGDGNTVEWKFLKLLVTHQYKRGLEAATKIRKRHVHFGLEKTDIKLATQLLSSNVSETLNLLRTQIELSEFLGSLGIERFCMIVSDMFDFLNSRQRVVENPKERPITVENIVEMRLKILEYEQYVRSLRDKTGECILNSNRKLGFIGLLVSLRSSLNIFEKYSNLAEVSLNYLLTYRLSQEHLEVSFSSTTSRTSVNRSLTAEQFQSVFKKMLVFAQIGASEYANCVG